MSLYKLLRDIKIRTNIKETFMHLSAVNASFVKLPDKSNVKNTVKFLIDYQAKRVMKYPPERLAKWTKQQLIDLGPTFVKIGQFVSSRSDIFDKVIIDELKTLQDKSPPFSSEEAKHIISEELGCPYDEIFSDFEDVPVASASISQVHRATLITSGEVVVIKVKRPHIAEYFERDFKTIMTILNLASVVNDRSINDSKVLLNECYEYLYEEISFENELKNLLKFQEILKDNPDIVVPKAYPEYSTNKILTMEYIPSTKISEIQDKRELLAISLMECFVKQILEHGMIHADPHPGNLGITTDGKVVLYDFGQVTKLEEQFMVCVKDMLFSVYDKDVSSITDVMIKTKAILVAPNTNPKKINQFIEKVIVYFQNVDFKEFQLSMLNSEMGEDIPFKINPKLIMMFRSLSLLEGTCKELDPDFNYYKVIDVLMSDFMFGFNYLDYKGKKDFRSLFDVPVNSDIEEMKTTLEENQKRYEKGVGQTLQQYQQMMAMLFMVSMFDDSRIRSILFLVGFCYLIYNVKKSNK
jgi:ubiquinone biosynthesis protein